MTALLLFLTVAIAALAIRRSPYLLIPYALTSISGDGFGVAMYLIGAGQGWFLICVRAIVMVAALWATFLLYRRRNETKFSRIAALLSIAAIVASAHIGIAWALKSGEFLSSFNASQWTGLYCIPIALSSKNIRQLFNICVAIILTQILIAVILYLFPSAPVISSFLGERYLYPEEYRFDVQDVGRLQGGRRLQAQFNNTNSYGLYATLGLALSLGLFTLFRSLSSKVVGGVLLGLSAVAWTQTVSRGSTLGLLLGVLAFFAAAAVAPRGAGRAASSVSVLVFFIFGAVGVGILYGETLGTLVNLDFKNDPMYVYRVNALVAGFQEIARHPFWGVPNEYIWPYNVPPHQLPIYYAATSGVLVGLLSTIMVFYPLFLLMRAGILNLSGMYMVAMVAPAAICGIYFGTVMTNNIAAPVILWSTYVLAVWMLHSAEHGTPKQFIRVSTRSSL